MRIYVSQALISCGKRKGDVISSFADALERKKKKKSKQSSICCFGKGFLSFPWADS